MYYIGSDFVNHMWEFLYKIISGVTVGDHFKQVSVY